MVLALALTWLVYATLRRDVSGGHLGVTKGWNPHDYVPWSGRYAATAAGGVSA
ncbi:hypothetical protein CCUG63695_00789 [Mycobacteroides franklinii]|uniref:Uncharacterized protein n=2 Tax=Mycobacteroides franklinii TaxID=948102 RepID=A0A4R8R0C4_9MYCO|nr:hypothetical protein CCUG64054_01424 [Mycobacteroides franklinii]TDZ49264.1 hypothetical protein CCUG63697_03800 [Mycobacteroides franklinii]TDZ59444.1 hypothetical protein CCUG63696_01426 [Mycobacteroides franklinii]TDZ66959.1 hypothetical protein CCUG63695_00789 [Mycobacteroides franklinii]TDZ72883.1 hypothetical protein CCUG64056_01424 [Mycobacteroides franklinii]